MSEELRQYKAFLKALRENPYDEATHRVFADWLSERGEDDEAKEHYEWSVAKETAKEFFRDLAPKVGMTYEEVLRHGDEIASGEFCFGDDDAQFIMREEYRAFLEHWRVHTGRNLEGTDEPYFRCAC